MAKLYFKYGTMNSGKSIELLKTAHNYEESNKNVAVLSPSVDTRGGVSTVSSRIGLSREAVVIQPDVNIYETIKTSQKFVKIDCILIDESQFLSKKQVKELGLIVDILDIPVICYGLKTDFMNDFFEGSKELLIRADKIIEIKTICFYCESKAIMNARIDKNGNQILRGNQVEIGGNDSYKAVCRKCYKEL